MEALSTPSSNLSSSHTGTIDGDENVERGNWSRQLDFLLSCLGYAVGLGNVWRFPYLSYSSGGGAFFIPYFIMLVFVGMPVFFLELTLGQFSSRGPVGSFKFAPILKGAGIGMVLVSATVATYYGVIISWAIFYLFASFTINKLPWEGCDNPWNTDACSGRLPDMLEQECRSLNYTIANNGFCLKNDGARAAVYDLAIAKDKAGFERVLSASEYYTRRVLNESEGIEKLGTVSWELALCLIAAWVLVILSLYKGVKSSGKVVYFTALFPYAVLIILFFRGVTLPGAGAGIKFYVTPQWHYLTKATVWRDAAGQIFFSLAVCWGGLIALASYNRFRNNMFKDTLIVALGNCTTSIFAGFVIYSYIGNLSHVTKTPVDEVSKDGAGLAFVIYPMAVLNLPGSPIWAILFFFMLITLGLDTQFTLIETITTTIFDAFPQLIGRKHWVIIATCFTFLLPGLIYVTQGGNYVLKMVDKYASGWNVLIVCLTETFAISYVYGYDRFAKDVNIMIGRKPPLFWKFCLMGGSQSIILFVLIFDWVNFESLSYGNYTFPLWANLIGWSISIYVVAAIPIAAAYQVKITPGANLKERIKAASKPSREWGPALPRHRMYVDYVKDWQIHPIRDRASTVFGVSEIGQKVARSSKVAPELETGPVKSKVNTERKHSEPLAAAKSAIDLEKTSSAPL
ncbi:sodium- and chloride-dependent glycine transporter 2-like [Watersipora subatra]|uniref:sodium- and chloride-dependent glycine transporter 2-like n=1 Tax=Watersipora subatra TaxID=2589382 RepID=UPI00355B60C8